MTLTEDDVRNGAREVPPAGTILGLLVRHAAGPAFSHAQVHPAARVGKRLTFQSPAGWVMGAWRTRLSGQRIVSRWRFLSGDLGG
jgi:hypothetical protein